MKTRFASISESLEESAKIDGANDFRILFNITLPLSLPVIAVMVLYYGVDRWNGWFYAMTFISDRSKYPLQLILRDILIENSTEMMQGMGDIERANVAETIKYAIIMVATLPIMLVYPFLQKYFVKGIMLGGVKY
ncbi:ABC-type glycerol-3-phosphate transport system permease component [Anaerotaenia torta]|uniref:carbohydrate ABC transporter permease n=1 Tax=Anaerotaenia torta TaxID=433293 RepID=UPI003D1DDA5D